VATGNHTEIVEGWANFHDIGSIGVHSIIGDLTKIEVFEFAKWINEKIYKREIIPHELYDGTIKPAAELVDASEDPFDYFVRSGIDAEMIRNRKMPEQLIKDFKDHKLTSEFFPKGWDGKDVYKLTEEEFTKQVYEAFKNSKRSVFKAAQSAPIVIISPRSRGFSNRETIINYYK
jgi:NAD+ synthase (glutamine-hydrolysing)